MISAAPLNHRITGRKQSQSFSRRRAPDHIGITGHIDDHFETGFFKLLQPLGLDGAGKLHHPKLRTPAGYFAQAGRHIRLAGARVDRTAAQPDRIEIVRLRHAWLIRQARGLRSRHDPQTKCTIVLQQLAVQCRKLLECCGGAAVHEHFDSHTRTASRQRCGGTRRRCQHRTQRGDHANETER